MIEIREKLEQICRIISYSNISYTGDISDIGNEIGYAVGYTLENMTQEQIDVFITGFKHGVSLTNGTH
jgi:hypothetical protein